MVKFCAFITATFIASCTFSQSTTPYSTLQRVIPPSPEAISINRAGFSDVNLYTGKNNYSIPLYTINQNGISFPLTLSYIGGSGLKIEEVASSAGLGWSLSSTGMVTRQIRGLADDVYSGNYIGYMHLPDFPVPDTSTATKQIYQFYGQNKYDGQPDLFSINVAGISAQFYIQRNKKILFVEKSDLKIVPVFSDSLLIAFEVKDLSGRTYYFSELEKSKSEPVNNTYAEYTNISTSSWYLTRVVSEYGKDVITFTYLPGDSNPIKQELRSPYQYSMEPLSGAFDESETSFSRLTYQRPLLQKINFPLGEVDFIMADSGRYDMGSDKYLKSIVVKDYLGNTIKHYNFHFSYFSTNGTIQQGQGTYFMYGNTSLRLKLDSLQDIGNANQKLTYQFYYNTTHYLPDRMSTFAMDHWGYYNGQTANTGWEAKNRVKYYSQVWPMSALDSFYYEFGSANREPDLEYAKSGMLEKVITPTGGQIQFDYELNTSADPRLPNKLGTSIFFATLNYTENYFHVNLINEPFAYIDITSLIDNSQYAYEYILCDSLSSGNCLITDTLKYGDDSHQYKLGPGTYFIKARVLGAHPDPSHLYFVKVFYENEKLITNKKAAGLRIRAMKLVDPALGSVLQRNYYYNESGDTCSTSLSTGEISQIPTYGHQCVELWSTDYIPNYFSPAYIIPRGYARLLTSEYPLGITSGSHVGYKKVTVVDSNQLKTENYFTSFKEFPEFAQAWPPWLVSTFEEATINGKKYKLTPLPPFDERDYLRGKMIKQVVYKNENGGFQKTKEIQNFYRFNMGIRVNDHTIMLPDTMEVLKGMVFESSGSNWRWNGFYLYTSKYDLTKTIEKTYTYQGGLDSLVNETSIEYGDSPWFHDSLYHYQPTKITSKTSTGKKITAIYYPYNWRYNIPDASSLEVDHMKILENENRIAVPVLQTIRDSATLNHISSIKNTYDVLANSTLAVNLIKMKQGAQSSFEDRMGFNRYDTLGNLLEQQKTTDIRSSFIWDYKNSYPVAEATNAGQNEIAYTSFEADGSGNWSGVTSSYILSFGGVTGAKYYNRNSFAISKSGLSSTSVYMVSYWTKNGQYAVSGTTIAGWPKLLNSILINGQTWSYYEHKVTAATTITVSGSGGIDELRLYPLNAQMTTYTYYPLIGISSQCDVNNRISFYQYDDLGRLFVIRDQNNNVHKKFCYNYTGQQENCTVFGNSSQTQTFTRNNCGTGYTGGQVTYTVPANTYYAFSQTSANALALADMALNGQNYANSNGACTIICNASNCTGNNKKCVTGTCETGIKVYTDTYWDASLNKWVCTYHYEWSDGSWSQNYTQYSNFACPV